MEYDLDPIVMELIVYAGNVRSLAILALRLARQGEYAQANQKMAECEEALLKAHSIQRRLIADELSGSAIPMTLLAVHAQDQMMNAMTVKDLVEEMIEMIETMGKEQRT